MNIAACDGGGVLATLVICLFELMPAPPSSPPRNLGTINAAAASIDVVASIDEKRAPPASASASAPAARSPTFAFRLPLAEGKATARTSFRWSTRPFLWLRRAPSTTFPPPPPLPPPHPPLTESTDVLAVAAFRTSLITPNVLLRVAAATVAAAAALFCTILRTPVVS